MCNFFSGILKKDGTVLYSINHDSHDTLIQENNLKTSEDSRTWLRFEILPSDGEESNRKKKNWFIKIDEAETPDWYTRNKAMYDEILFKTLKKTFRGKDKMKAEAEKNKVVRFDFNTESKLMKTLGKLFGEHEGISEEMAMEREDMIVVDPAHVCMARAKTEQARRILTRFADPEISHKAPTIDWEINDKKYIARSGVSLDYMEKILAVIKCVQDHYFITAKCDSPVRLECDDFEFLVAPRIENE
jgi:hypothetical protein